MGTNNKPEPRIAIDHHLAIKATEKGILFWLEIRFYKVKNEKPHDKLQNIEILRKKNDFEGRRQRPPGELLTS